MSFQLPLLEAVRAAVVRALDLGRNIASGRDERFLPGFLQSVGKTLTIPKARKEGGTTNIVESDSRATTAACAWTESKQVKPATLPLGERIQARARPCGGPSRPAFRTPTHREPGDWPPRAPPPRPQSVPILSVSSAKNKQASRRGTVKRVL